MDEIIQVSMDEIENMMQRCFPKGAAFELTVTGSSMSPTLCHYRDSVWLVPPSVRPVKLREILLYKRPDGSLVLHRLIHMKKDGTLLMNGDGQVETEEIHGNAVIAVAEKIQRKGNIFSCDATVYRSYVRLWSFTRPFRNILVRVKKFFGRHSR